MSKVADSIRRGLRQAVAYAEGKGGRARLSRPRAGEDRREGAACVRATRRDRP